MISRNSNYIYILAILSGLFLSSCAKEFADFEDGQVIENSYEGTWEVTSRGQDPAGDFEGSNDNGTFSFIWDNPERKANVNFDVTAGADGSVTMRIFDAKGDEVLNETRPSGGEDTFSGVTDRGRKGKWKVELQLTNFDGDGSYSLSPGE